MSTPNRVGLSWELSVWKPKLSRLIVERARDLGTTPTHLSPEARDAIVLESLDVLPVPVLHLDYTPEDGRAVDLGWVGESLARLEVDGKMSSMRSIDREVWMRRACA